MRATAGFVDGHSHLRSTSLVAHGVPGSCLEEGILRMNAMTGVDPVDDAFVATSDLLLAGVTGVQVIFHTFGTPDQYLETLAKTLSGIRKSKIRARVILAITDQYEFLPSRVQTFTLPDFIDVGLRMTPEEFRTLFDAALEEHPDIDFGVGPVAPQWCSDAMLAAIGDIARRGIRVHTHCLESASQRNWIDETPIERLDRFGLLGHETSLAHAIWLTDEELDLISERKTQLITCPHSNRILKSGSANLGQWLSRGIEFGIGLDSAAGRESPLEVARLVLSEEEALSALTSGGAIAAGLPTQLDSVVWQDWNSGIVETLTLAGEPLIVSGQLANSEEVDAARVRIAATMATDQLARESRQRRLSAVMTSYLGAVR